jgi:hypothetical protein
VSADGRRVVGTSDGEFSFAFVWEESTGMRALPSLSTGFGDARASAINAAGDVFVGTSASRAVLWRNERITDLGMLDGRYQTVAYGVNATGTVVVGDGSSSPFLRDNGFVWTPERGMEHLSAYLGALGVALPVGSELSRVYGVSPDGRTFAGGGRFGGVSAGFVITIPTPGALGVGLVACFLGAGRRRP